MKASMIKILPLALATVMVLGTLDAASARQKKRARATPPVTQSDYVPATLVPVDRDGTPIIMQGFRSPRMMRDSGEPSQRADRPVKIPRGSSTYIPPPDPSPYSRNSPPAVALTQPAPQPYKPPPITTFSDRVNSAIQAYPLQKGIGNNPIDQQQFIRQQLNQ
jgi:hypothetical protein